MKKILILATGWSNDFWESDKEAPYPNLRYTEFSEWDRLSNSCPLPGIGRYIGDFSQNPFIYLEIKGMRSDPNTLQPYFEFSTIAKSKTESYKLEQNLPSDKRKFISVIKSEKLVEILQGIGEEPPEEWKKLIKAEKEIIRWKDYIGKYFLQIEDTSLSNDEFEDRVAVLFNALGFKVNQKGHKLSGEYPDGIASFDGDYAIVYDCKNTHDFSPTAQDERAIRKYLEDERTIRSERKIYCAFIAKSLNRESRRDIFFLPINSLICLLCKKLMLGAEFNLSPLKKILENFIPFSGMTIDKEWRK